MNNYKEKPKNTLSYKILANTPLGWRREGDGGGGDVEEVATGRVWSRVHFTAAFVHIVLHIRIFTRVFAIRHN